MSHDPDWYRHRQTLAELTTRSVNRLRPFLSAKELSGRRTVAHLGAEMWRAAADASEFGVDEATRRYCAPVEKA